MKEVVFFVQENTEFEFKVGFVFKHEIDPDTEIDYTTRESHISTISDQIWKAYKRHRYKQEEKRRSWATAYGVS